MDDVSLPGVTVPPQMMDDGLDSLDIMVLETSYNLVGTEVHTNPEDLLRHNQCKRTPTMTHG
jgi:hypothetical protein